MLRLQLMMLPYLASIRHFPYLKLGGHLEIHTPLTSIFIIVAYYTIYSAASLDSLLSVHILVVGEGIEPPTACV